jgi:hypothetical protein
MQTRSRFLNGALASCHPEVQQMVVVEKVHGRINTSNLLMNQLKSLN